MPVKIISKPTISETPPEEEIFQVAGYTPKNPSSTPPAAPAPAAKAAKTTAHPSEQAQPVKRGPGRPKGSKTLNKRAPGEEKIGGYEIKPLHTPPTEDQLNAMSEVTDETHFGDAKVRENTQEFRRKQVLRLSLRGVPVDTIAKHLGFSTEIIRKDLIEINRNMRADLQHLDVPTYIGYSLAFYEEARNIALRIATDNSVDKNGKPKVNVGAQMGALRTALVAEDARHAFLHRIGLFKIVSPTDPFANIQTGRQGSYSDENDMNSFMQSIAQMAAETQQITDVQGRDR